MIYKKHYLYLAINILLIIPLHASKDANINNLPAPYNSLETILPFDNHGWYRNAKWISKLFESNKITTVIEIGSWLGKSSRHMASLLPITGKLYAVDTWKGSLCQQPKNDQYECSHKLPTLYEQFLSNVIHEDLANKIIPVQMESLQAAKFLTLLQQKTHLIYIDAEHDTKSVFEDMEAWYPYVFGQKGILCGDDWGWESVRVGVRMFAEKYNLTIYAAENFWFILEKNLYSEHSFLNAPECIWKILE